MVFVFLCLTFFTQYIISRSIHVAAYGIISFFFMAEYYSIVYVDHIFIHWQFTAALYTITKTWKQPVSIRRWIWFEFLLWQEVKKLHQREALWRREKPKVLRMRMTPPLLCRSFPFPSGSACPSFRSSFSFLSLLKSLVSQHFWTKVWNEREWKMLPEEQRCQGSYLR